MIRFNDSRIFVKGTCSATLTDIKTGDVIYQTDKLSTGSIQASVGLEEIREGYGNPITAFIPVNSKLQVEFEAADFQPRMKAAQIGADITYSAPYPECQIVTATSSTLQIDVSNGVPVAEFGAKKPYAYIQTVGTKSLIIEDGKAYEILPDGTVDGFEATEGLQYKVWFFLQKVSAQKVEIGSYINPRTARFTAQIAVFSGNGIGGARGSMSRIGWIYYTVPYMKLSGESILTGSQTTADTTKIVGQAMSFASPLDNNGCGVRPNTSLGYMVFSPDSARESIKGIAVIGGIVTVTAGNVTQTPVVFVMVNGTTEQPTSYSDGFTYRIPTEEQSVAIVNESGEILGVSAGNAECYITYRDSTGETYSCTATILVAQNPEMENRVGFGRIGFMKAITA